MRLSVAMYSLNQELSSGKMDMEGFIHFCGDLGIEGVELLAYYWKDREREIQLIPAWLENNDLTLAGYGVKNNFIQTTRKQRKEQIDYVKSEIDTAATINAPVMRVFGGLLHNGMTVESGLEMVIDCLAECAEYADTNNITLGLENLGYLSRSLAPPGTSGEVIHVINSVNSPSLRALIDMTNFLYRGQDPLESLKELLPYAVHVHLKDIKSVSAQSFDRPDEIKSDDLESCVLGDGIIDFEKTYEVLKKGEYEGFLSLEYEGKKECKEAVKKSIAFAKNIIS